MLTDNSQGIRARPQYWQQNQYTINITWPPSWQNSKSDNQTGHGLGAPGDWNAREIDIYSSSFPMGKGTLTWFRKGVWSPDPVKGGKCRGVTVVNVGTGYYVECLLIRSRNKIKWVCLITQQWHDVLSLMFPLACQLKCLFPSLVLLSIHTEATILCVSRLKSEATALHVETRNTLKARYFYKKQLSLQSFLKVNNLSKHCKVDVYIDWLA
jgi:hypothetical protein